MKLSKAEVVDELATLVNAVIVFPDHMTDTSQYKELAAMMRKRSQWLYEHYEEDNE